jgi:ribosomal protein L17
MKTAVEWLVEELEQSILMTSSVETTIKKAKEMFEQQIIKAFKTGECDGNFETINAEQYYNETFKSNKV